MTIQRLAPEARANQKACSNVLDFSDEAFQAQLINQGTYHGRLVEVKLIGVDPALLVFTWQLEVAGRTEAATVEEIACVDVGPGGDPAQAAIGRARIRAIIDAHGIEPTFANHDQLIRAIVGKKMQVVVRHGRKAGLPVAKVAALLPPAAEDG